MLHASVFLAILYSIFESTTIFYYQIKSKPKETNPLIRLAVLFLEVATTEAEKRRDTPAGWRLQNKMSKTKKPWLSPQIDRHTPPNNNREHRTLTMMWGQFKLNLSQNGDESSVFWCWKSTWRFFSSRTVTATIAQNSQFLDHIICSSCWYCRVCRLVLWTVTTCQGTLCPGSRAAQGGFLLWTAMACCL